MLCLCISTPVVLHCSKEWRMTQERHRLRRRRTGGSAGRITTHSTSHASLREATERKRTHEKKSSISPRDRPAERTLGVLWAHAGRREGGPPPRHIFSRSQWPDRLGGLSGSKPHCVRDLLGQR